MDQAQAALDSRLLTRALIVSGILGLVFVWQVERAIKTAYGSEWVARGTQLRLPTETWEWVFSAAGFVSVLLLLGAALLWRRREGKAAKAQSPSTELKLHVTTTVLSVLTVVFGLATATARWYAADGRAEGALTVATVFSLISVACVVAVALTTGNLVYEHLGGLRRVFRGVLQRQRMNLLVVFALAAALMFVGETSGQSVDSIRSWSPLVFGTHDHWSGSGAARLLLGLAAALVFAVSLYESGTRLNRATLRMDEPKRGRLLAAAVATTVAGVVVLVVSAGLGPGLLIGGVVLLLIWTLDQPHLAATDREVGETGGADPEPLLTRAELNAPEWIAITPLLALAAVSVTATVEAMLSAGARDGNAWLTLLPALVLGVLATLMTRRRPTTPLGVGLLPCTLIGAVVVGLSLVFFLLALSLFDDFAEWWMAFYGAAWCVVLAVYTIEVFHRNPREAPDVPQPCVRRRQAHAGRTAASREADLHGERHIGRRGRPVRLRSPAPPGRLAWRVGRAGRRRRLDRRAARRRLRVPSRRLGALPRPPQPGARLAPGSRRALRLGPRRLHRQQRPVLDRRRLAVAARADRPAQPRRGQAQSAQDRAVDRRAGQPLPEVDPGLGALGRERGGDAHPTADCVRRPFGDRGVRPRSRVPDPPRLVHGHDLAGASPRADRSARLGALPGGAFGSSSRVDESASCGRLRDEGHEDSS